jgi:hypothetical protein
MLTFCMFLQWWRNYSIASYDNYFEKEKSQYTFVIRKQERYKKKVKIEINVMLKAEKVGMTLYLYFNK